MGEGMEAEHLRYQKGVQLVGGKGRVRQSSDR